MALSAMQEALCNQLQQKFDPNINALDIAKSTFRSRVADFDSQIRALTFGSQTDINNAISTLQNQSAAITPSNTINDMDDLKTFINSCSFFSGANPIGSIIGSLLGIYDKIDSLIDSIAASLPEFGVGNIADAINNLIDSNFGNVFRQNDQIIECVTNLCGSADHTSWIITAASTLDNLYDSFSIVSDSGSSNYLKFDYDTFYSNAGISSGDQVKMNSVIDGIGGVKSAARDSVSGSVEKAKSLIKTGGFF